ncbi:MAG TPA: transposase [Prolixibacteraceae bacterium]|nr:transposase [Prolixibacteraceae bacterium]
MIPKVKELKLIAMYLYISDIYKYDLMYSCQRFSNNSKPEFTDEEVMTIYLYAMHIEQRFKVKQIYEYACDHLRSWFPLLPSYEAFNMRLNRLGEAFKLLSANIISMFVPSDCVEGKSLLDSMPIITCSGKRSGKVAREITDKGYCSTKGIYYYGLKLHALAFHRPHHLPFPEQFQLTPASESDLNLFKQAWGEIENRTFFGDKIYNDSQYFQDAENSQNSLMLTPVKAVKGQDEALKQRDKAANDLFSTAVSRIRQPIESLFNWLIEKTDIQRASKVRSTKGLMVYVFGRLAAAYISLIFNP